MKIYYNKKIVDEIHNNSENIHKITNKIVEDVNNMEGLYANKDKLNNLLKKLNSQADTLKNYIVDVKNVYDKLEIEDEILDKDNIRKYDPLTYCDNYVKSINYCLQTNQLFDNNNSKISSLTNMLFLLFEINDYTEEYKLYLELREFIRKGYRIDNYINYRKDNKFPLLNSILEQEDFKNYEEDDIYEGDYIYGSLLLHNNIEELDDLIRDIDSNLGEQTIVFTNISTSTKILSKDPHYIDLVVNTREYINNNNFYIVDSYPKNIKDEKRYSISYPFVNNEEFNKNFDVKRIKDGIIKISAKETITKENLKLLDILGLTIYVGKKTDTDVVIEVKEVNTVDLFEQSLNNIYSKLLIDINKNKNIGKEIVKVKELSGGRKMEENKNEEVKVEEATIENTEFDLEPIKLNLEKGTSEPVLPEPPIVDATIDPVAEAMKTPLETEPVEEEKTPDAIPEPAPVLEPEKQMEEPNNEETSPALEIPPVIDQNAPLINPETNTPVENYENPEVNTVPNVDEQLKTVDNMEGPTKKNPLVFIIIAVLVLLLIIGGVILYSKFFNKEETDNYELRALQDITTTITEEFFDNNKSCQVFKNGTLDEVETSKITYEGIVNTSEEGEYTITCKYTDPNKKEQTATRKVIVEYPMNGDIIETKILFNDKEVSKDVENPTEIRKFGAISFTPSINTTNVLGECEILDNEDNVLKKEIINPYGVIIIENLDATKIRFINKDIIDIRYIIVTE